MKATFEHKFNIGDLVRTKSNVIGEIQEIEYNINSFENLIGYRIKGNGYGLVYENDLEIFEDTQNGYKLLETLNFYYRGKWDKVYHIEKNDEKFCVSLDELQKL